MMWHMTAPAEEVFKMTICQVFSLTGRKGLFLAGEIESGVLYVGDRLNLLDGETIVREVTCDGVEFVLYSSQPVSEQMAVYVKELRPGDAREGQALARIGPPGPRSVRALRRERRLERRRAAKLAGRAEADADSGPGQPRMKPDQVATRDPRGQAYPVTAD
jgi:hypothetical protein